MLIEAIGKRFLMVLFAFASESINARIARRAITMRNAIQSNTKNKL
jgi:hypothetical protein